MTMPRPYPNPNSRFQIVPAPVLSPGKCLVCGTPNRAVVDTGVELDVEGYAFRVYFCILCLRDANSQVEGYLESIGELKGGADTVRSYLDENNLKVVTDEQFDNFIFWATGISACLDSVVSNPFNADDEDVEDEPEGDSGTNAEDDPKPQPVTEFSL